MTVLETERLLLRHLVPSDREALLDLVSRWEVVRNLARCFDRYWRERHRDSDGPVFSRTV